MRDVALLLAVNLCFLVAGVGVTGAVGWWSSRGELLRALGFAYLAGVAAYGVAAQLLYVLGAPLTAWQVVAVCLVLGAGALVPGRHPGRTYRLSLSRAELLLLAFVTAMLALVAVDLWFQPLWNYDSWTFWTPKATALVKLDGLDAGWFTQADLLNRDYPLLLPAVEAAGFRFTGVQTRLLDLQSWLFVVGFVGAYLHLVGSRAPRLVTWTVLTMICLAPAVATQAAYAEADIPLAVLFACAGLLGYLWLETHDGRMLVLLALFAAAVAATKVEGLIFVVSLVIALVIASRRAAPLAAGAAALAVGLLPWRIWTHAHDVKSQSSLGRVLDVSFLIDHAGRLPYSTVYVGSRLLDPTAWLLLLPLAALALVLAWRSGSRTSVVFTVLTFALSMVGLLLAYWTTPFELHYHLATSARRVISGPVLFLAAVTPLLARRASDP